MQFNYYFLKWLTPALEKRLIGKKVTALFSQSKNELVLSFEDEKSTFHIKANLDSQIGILAFPKEFARAKKNSVDLFGNLIDRQVTSISQFKNERCFSIHFGDKYQLVFKLHGRRANVILCKFDTAISLFNTSMLQDLELSPSALDRPIDQSKEALIANDFDLRATYPTFDKNIYKLLKSKGFDDATTNQEKLDIIHEVLTLLNQPVCYIVEDNAPAKLLLYPADNLSDTCTDPIEASNLLAQRFFSKYQLQKTKAALLGGINKDIKKCHAYLANSKQKLTEIQERRGYDELANILMANLHIKVPKEAKSIEVLDIYNQCNIDINIKANTSLQKNAELLYKKYKNQSKEIGILTNNIQNKQKILGELITRKEQVEKAEKAKELKAFDQKKKNNLQSAPSLFIEQVIDGYQVYIGKNAKNNDLLTQKHAKKDDLWLHARDVSGSHVVIKNPNGHKIPMHTIERVAQLAAWHSKRKSDSLCPVIYTPKKYVRKPKGGLPGQVLVTREEVILVEPKRRKEF